MVKKTQTPTEKTDPVIQQMLLDNGWIAEQQVADFEGLELGTVAARRSRGHMPSFMKCGKTTIYRVEDIAQRIKQGAVATPWKAKPDTASDDLLNGKAV